ncbi:hypothetical protein BKCO1_3700057 [Neofusicoccum parvum]|uniref:Uncharacterized protein n=1 Tax=Neofusicoccum parvum TaxID=310453 RepID=A0ACB5S3K8_9PEZI|nr:hypothetical protein BKCO1_3700057 [Neofusicoccum parvum]GME40108.1 hypothetical protein BKCO1_3700057 [Neofusicoccum parvum]
MNQMDSYNPSFFNQTSAHQQFGSSPAHAQPAHGPLPPQFAQGIQPPHHPAFSNGAAAAGGGGFPLASSMGMGSAQAGAGGVMMQPGAMQQQSPRVPQSPYTTAPFSTPISAPNHQQQHHFQNFNKNISPPRHVSPYAATPQQQHQQQQFQQQQHQSLPDSSQPMAAPVSLPSHAAQPKPQPQGQPQKPMAATPASPGQLQREKEQVTLLLEINRELLQEVLRLQEQGKGGMMNAQPAPGQDGNKEGDAAKKVASKEYIDCMRRLQANLSYLASFADHTQNPHKPVPPGPAIMTIPASPQALAEMYTKLGTLFPGWKGQLLKPGGVPGQGSPARPNMPQQQSPQAHSQG